MADESEETRLDRLWLAVADTGADADWLRFYEGFAAQVLTVPVDDAEDAAVARPRTLALASGEVALAFDTAARFAAFITEPTAFITLTGAALAASLAPSGVGVAVNPGVAPGETVLDPQALAWIAEHFGAAVDAGRLPPGSRARPPAGPEPELLDALGARLLEMEGHIGEAWLLGVTGPDGEASHLCVLEFMPETGLIADEVAAELSRIGQIRSSRPFSVAVAGADSQLLAAARRQGIGLVAPR